MKARAIVLVTVPMFVLFVIMRMPVSLVYERVVAEKLPANVTVAAVSGSVWNGRAHGIGIDGHRLGDIDWSLEGVSVLSPAVRIAFAAEADHRSHLTGRLIVKALDGGLRLGDIKGTVDVRNLEDFLQTVPAKLTGSIELDLAAIELARDKPYVGSAEGVATWSAASVVEPVAVELGTVELHIAPARQAQGVEGRFRNAGGVVATQGRFSLDGEGRYEVDLAARPEGSPADKLETILQFGKPNADGSRQFSFSGQL